MVFKRFADHTNKQSVASRLRYERLQILLEMLRNSSESMTILDIGGDPQFWELILTDSSLDNKPHITLLNVEIRSVSHPNLTAIVGDGRAMPQFANKHFDIVFSSSTIEHVGNFDAQRQMASEVRRIGHRYYVQTPNRYFPIEPHFVFPFFQFLPVVFRGWLVQHFKLGWYAKIPDRKQALAEVSSIRLMTRKEIREIFPDAILFEEKFYGFVKSFVAYTATKAQS
jgi:SAM-dependent methyltransferase